MLQVLHTRIVLSVTSIIYEDNTSMYIPGQS